MGEQVQVDRRTDRRRKGREGEKREDRAEQEQAYWSRLRARGLMNGNRTGLGWGVDGWARMG